ncbi:H-NS histone family protein [Burkholderia gladioli]|uniref:H-NS histone family protein n=1 Tax=Burkholderia gladioli TaxID=28095 RepID=UPI0016418A6E|nr:H-NS histone family protein [Burkholderia gladioli]MBU9640287.1 H-NS histone family protein [Burkholderia gladioli]
MSNYHELLAQLNELTRKASEAREAELKIVIADIRRAIAEYGLTERDLFPPRLGRPRKEDQKPKPRYRDPETGATWTGRGRVPGWIAGQDRERFLIS